MHEYSVVTALLEQCDTYAASENAVAIDEVVVGIGERSGIEPTLLQSAFKMFREESQYAKKARLHIHIHPVVLECVACGVQNEPKQKNYALCVVCGSRNVRIIQGRDMVLLRLEMQTPHNANTCI